jgi:hypothetical protein
MLTSGMAAKRIKMAVPSGNGGQPNESEPPPLEPVVSSYMALESQKKTGDSRQKKKAKKC